MSARNTYLRPMSGWWRRNPFFVRYMLREATSVFLAVYAVVLMAGLGALASGPDAYDRWLAFLRHPLAVLLHVAILAAAAYHTYTWIAVSPKAMPPLYLGGERVSATKIIAGQYVALAVASIGVLALAAAA